MAIHNAIRLNRISTDGYKHVQGVFVTIDTDKHDSPKQSCNKGEVVWPDLYGPTKVFRDLEIWSQSGPDCHYYSWELRYRDIYSASIRDLEGMTKQLRGMESRLTKYADKHGRASTVAQYFLQVALTNKVDYFVTNNRSDQSLGFKLTSADGGSLRFLDSFATFEEE